MATDDRFQFLLAAEPDVPIDTGQLVATLNAHCRALVAHSATQVVVIRQGSLPARSTQFMPSGFREQAKTVAADRTILFSQIPFEDNYFFHGPDEDGLLAISMYAWADLTSLPMENGALFFLVKQTVFSLHVPERHYARTGCVFDFLADKRGVDTGMRAAFLCPSCDKAVRSAIGQFPQRIALLEDAIRLLDLLCRASRANESIFKFSAALLSGDGFDAFMCHNSQDKLAVRRVASALRTRRLAPWLDEEQIAPGRQFQTALSDAIPRIRSALVFVGQSGVGPWQNQEIQSILSEFIRRVCPVIPVLLVGGAADAHPELPLFLRNFMWVRDDQADFLDRLVWGITGNRN